MQELALERTAIHLQRHGLAQIALRNGADGSCHLNGGADQIVHQGVQGLHFVRPAPDQACQGHSLLEPSFAPHQAAHAFGLPGAALVHGQHVIEGVRDLAIHPLPAHRQAHGEIAVAERHHGFQQHKRLRTIALLALRQSLGSRPRVARSVAATSRFHRGSCAAGGGGPPAAIGGCWLFDRRRRIHRESGIWRRLNARGRISGIQPIKTARQRPGI